jgi:hypothetical protein
VLDSEHKTPTMTEIEWNDCSDVNRMIEFLAPRAGERKLRLFAVACCRRIWRLLPDERLRHAVNTLERYAEGVADAAALAKARDEAQEVLPALGGSEALRNGTWGAARMVAAALDGPAAKAARSTAAWIVNLKQAWTAVPTIRKAVLGAMPAEVEHALANTEGRKPQVAFLRDLFGDPFHPCTIEPRWLERNDGVIVKLAKSIYDAENWGELPNLADTLVDVGCTRPAVLNHFWEPGTHIRGCWALDLLLGKQ